jgi:hypothetical protein
MAVVPGGKQSVVGTRGYGVMGMGGNKGEMIWGKIPGTVSQYRWFTPEEYAKLGQQQPAAGARQEEAGAGGAGFDQQVGHIQKYRELMGRMQQG